MRLDCTVTSCERRTDSFFANEPGLLRVRLLGNVIGSAAWRGLQVHEIAVPATAANQRAFRVGRRLAVTIAAETGELP